MDKYYSDIQFILKTNGFQHNLADDYSCFALWNSAKPYKNKIKDYLCTNFQMILEAEVEWSHDNFHSNASRIYETPMFYNESIKKKSSPFLSKIVDNKFMFIVVKDLHPVYTYAKSVSNNIELSNLNIVKAKYLFREWIYNHSGYKYGVHSSNNLYEFFYQTTLILGVDIFNEIINNKKFGLMKIQKDVEGANGWQSWKQLFDVLNLSTNYLVLRNFEEILDNDYKEDISFLTDNYQRIASALGVYQQPNKLYKGYLKIQNRDLPVDIRFIGDKYFDTSWQKDMLTSKIFNNGIYVPRNDFYFFNLLYHCMVQQHELKKKYHSKLNKLAEELRLNWYSENILNSNIKTSEIINGYFKAYDYYYEKPIDEKAIKNKKIISHLITRESNISKGKNFQSIVNNILRCNLSYKIDCIINNLKHKLLEKQIDKFNESKMKIYKGEIVKGRGVAKKFIESLSDFYKQNKLEVYPGTLNVVLKNPVNFNEKKAMGSIRNEYFFWEVKINGIDCFATRWRNCPFHIIEVVSNKRLRDYFGEGQEVINVEIKHDLLERITWWNLLLWNIAWRGRNKVFYKNDFYMGITYVVKRYINKFHISTKNFRQRNLSN